jgi:TonB family protein
MRTAIVNPLPAEASLQSVDFETKDIKADRRDKGSLDLVCFTLKSRPTAASSGIHAIAIYCFDAKGPFLRTRGIFGNREDTTANNPILFHNHWIAGDLAFGRNGKPALTVHVDLIEHLANGDDALFTPPANATPIRAIKIIGVKGSGTSATDSLLPGQVSISGGVARSNLVQSTPPLYPAVAKAAYVQGTVVLEAIINKEGHIRDLQVVSGPPLLQQAAIDAVTQWVYRPYLFNGKPVEVRTTVNVIFTLGGPPKPASPEP